MKLEFWSYYLSPISIDDAESLHSFIASNKDRINRYFPKTVAQNSTLEWSKIFADKKVNEFNDKEEFLFTLKEKNKDKLVGLIYLKALDWEKKKGEFAYCIDKSLERKGITTQAIKQLSEFAFDQLKLETLQIIVHKSNIPSIKIAKNCNFYWIKTLEKEFTPPGEKPLDMELYELYNNIT